MEQLPSLYKYIGWAGGDAKGIREWRAVGLARPRACGVVSMGPSEGAGQRNRAVPKLSDGGKKSNLDSDTGMPVLYTRQNKEYIREYTLND